MGILNITPDSFAEHCSALTPEVVLSDFQSLVQQGASIIDIGGCSTRPGAVPVSMEEEWQRLEMALLAIRKVYPNYPISIDTFRASIAQKCIERFQVQIINDISGMSDLEMLPLLSRARIPYVLTHPREQCVGWNISTPVMAEMVSFFSHKLDTLHRAGITDVIIDPGLGFGKSIEQNYTILRHLSILQSLHCPIMVGISRKSMIHQVVDTTPQQALNGSTVAHTLALIQGAQILRVHDIPEAIQTITIVQQYQSKK